MPNGSGDDDDDDDVLTPRKFATIYDITRVHVFYETSNSNGNNGPARSYLDVVVYHVYLCLCKRTVNIHI